jgi:choline kinase
VTIDASPKAVADAIVLAAGNGDRFLTEHHRSKLLQTIRGEPLIVRTLRCAAAAGITRATVVLGYQADQIRSLLSRTPIKHLQLTFALNPDWRLENGRSVLAARLSHRTEPFALLMGDHVFEPRVLARLRRSRLNGDALILGVDRHETSPEIIREATKVRLRGSRITAIGKHLAEFDALDTGMFVCRPSLFDALAEAGRSGDTTLTAGVALLAASGQARARDVSGSYWCDVDTVEDLQGAEAAMPNAAAVS